MRSKMVITKIAERFQKGTRRMLCLEYTLNHNQKKNNYIPQIHVHPQLAQTNTCRHAYIPLHILTNIYIYTNTYFTK